MTEKQLPSRVRPIAGDLQSLDRRLYELERATQKPTQTRLMPNVFSYPGTISVGIVSPPWYPEHSVEINACRVSLTTAAFADLTIEIRKNGGGAFQVTLPGGSLTVQQGIYYSLNANDYLTVTTVTVPAASNMSVGFKVRYL